MPPTGKRARKGGSGTPLNPEPVLPEQEEADETHFIEKAKRKKTMSCFTEQLKEEIIEFLMNNEVLYSKRLSGFKDITRKDELWTAQTVKMNTTAEQLKTWYTRYLNVTANFSPGESGWRKHMSNPLQDCIKEFRC